MNRSLVLVFLVLVACAGCAQKLGAKTSFFQETSFREWHEFSDKEQAEILKRFESDSRDDDCFWND